MRSTLYLLAAVLAVSTWSNESRAQSGGVFDDPFFTYYGYFLPRQAALAAQPRVEDTINQNFVNNQVAARTNRASLYDPNGGYGAFDNYDPNDAFSKPLQRGRQANATTNRRSFRGLPTTNINGRGPALYYNRASQFYPSLRTGIGPNRNLAVTGRGIRGGGGGMGMPSATAGISPGPR